MQIWRADFYFEILSKEVKKNYYTVKDVVAIKIPSDHIHRKSDIVKRAVRGVSDKILVTLAKDVRGNYKVKINYKKQIGVTNDSDTTQ